MRPPPFIEWQSNDIRLGVLLRGRLHRRLGIDEAEAVELAVALAYQVEEPALELPAAREAAEEARSAEREIARRNQHAACVGRSFFQIACAVYIDIRWFASEKSE